MNALHLDSATEASLRLELFRTIYGGGNNAKPLDAAATVKSVFAELYQGGTAAKQNRARKR